MESVLELASAAGGAADEVTMKARRAYRVYEIRAATEGTDNAMYYEDYATLEEAQEAVRETWIEGAIFSYEIHENPIYVDDHLYHTEELFDDERFELVISQSKQKVFAN